MIDLEAIKKHRALWEPDDRASLPTICEHVDALVAEVERLRAESLEREERTARIMIEAERHRRISDEAIARLEKDDEEQAEASATWDQVEAILDGFDVGVPRPGAKRVADLLREVERLRSINDGYLLEMGRQHALLRDQKRGENAERAAVVAWLREYANPGPSDADNLGVLAPGARTVGRLADAIECGEHRKEEE